MRKTATSLALVAAFVISACGPTAPAPAAPAASGQAPAKVAITGETAREIEAVLARRAQALSRRDLAAFQATFDATRASLRRCQTQEFEIASRLGASSSGAKVAKVEPYLDQYVRAYAGGDSSGYQRLYFRQEAGRWILTEPLERELGGDKTATLSGIQMSYFGIDEDVIAVYAKTGAEVLEFVKTKARGPTGKPFGLRIFPTRGAAGATVDCNVAAFHLPNMPDDPFIRLFSGALHLAPGFTAVSESSTSYITHDALHWLQDQIVPGIAARLDWWMVEGWPDFIAQSRPEGVKRQVICNTPTPTFKLLVDSLIATPETPPELEGQLYAFANSMVEYLYVTHGDDAYFKLIEVYKETVDPKITYPKVLGVTPEQFYERWKVWAKQKFC